MARLLVLILSLSMVLDLSVAEAGRRRSKGRTNQTRARKAPARPKATPEQLAEAARKRQVAEAARAITDQAFKDCTSIGNKVGKNELDADFHTRRCLVLVLWAIEKRIVESKKLTGEELFAHVDLMNGLDATYKMSTVENLNDFDRLNLYQAILTAKKTQLAL